MLKKETNPFRILNATYYSHSDVDSFDKVYTKGTNEILKLKFKKKVTEKSIYKIKNIYTRYEGTRDTKTVLEQNPFKRFRNTSCPFQVTFKVLKVATNAFT